MIDDQFAAASKFSCSLLDMASPVELDLDNAKGFTYAPLEFKDHAIRLVQLEPNKSPDGHIRCKIRQSTTNDEYTCLSYEWGTEPPDHVIFIDDALFLIRRNLFDFLDIARTKYSSTWFWIGALCIDQENISERNYQVQRMGRVYEHAQEVISWLGAEPWLTQDFDTDHPAFKVSSYWDRAWVTQEVALARHVTIMADTLTIDLAHAYKRQKDLGITDDRGGVSNSTHDPSQWHLYKGKGLITLLTECVEKECATYHDKIYSLLGLCGEGSDIEVDYNLTRHQLALKVLRACQNEFCLCAVFIVARALGLVTKRHTSYIGSQEHTRSSDTVTSMFLAQYNLPTSSLSQNVMDVGALCMSHEGVIELHTLQGQDGVLLKKCELRKGGTDGAELVKALKAGVSIQSYPEDSTIVVYFTFAALLECSLFFKIMDFHFCGANRSLGNEGDNFVLTSFPRGACTVVDNIALGSYESKGPSRSGTCLLNKTSCP